MRVSPTARAPNINARWLIDLSPGAAIRPASGAAAGWPLLGRGTASCMGGLLRLSGRGTVVAWSPAGFPESRPPGHPPPGHP